jgi:hypothetical protein
MVKAHGLLIEPPLHEAGETLQPPKVYPELVIEYETEIVSPA